MIRTRLSAMIAAFAMLAFVGCETDGPSGPNGAAPDALMQYGDGRGGGGPPNGGGDEGVGNNLSNPVVWAEGVGLTGGVIAAATDFANTGVRPLVAETAPYNALTTSATLPFFWSGNVPDGNGCYLQKTANTWQPQWILGTSGVEVPARVDWGDNLRSQTLTATSVIRIEHTLYDDATSATGFVMDPACTSNPSSPDEIQGTKNVTGTFTPTIFSVMPMLKMEKLDGPGGNPVAGGLVFDLAVADGFGQDGPGFYGSEVNVGGKLIYGYVLFMKRVNLGTLPKDGWYRITFSLQGSATLPTGPSVSRGVKMASVDATDVAAALSADGYSTWMDVEIKSSRGGGGRQNPNGGKK